MTQSKFTTLADLIAQVESGGNHFASRFEPAHEPRISFINQMVSIAKCNFVTAKILCSMSFGLYQIMGDELMDLDLTRHPFDYAGDITLQAEFFNRYCIRNNCEYTLDDVINDESKRLDFARKYNGPGNVEAYAQRIIDIYEAIK